MDAIEAILALLYALLHWRVIVCFGLSIAVAFILGQQGWPSVPQILVIAFIGIIPGTVWQARTESRTAPAIGPTTTSTSAQYLTAVLAGSAWGAVSSESPYVIAMGAALQLAVCWAWHFYAVRVRQWLSAQKAVSLLVVVHVSYFTASAVANAA